MVIELAAIVGEYHGRKPKLQAPVLNKGLNNGVSLLVMNKNCDRESCKYIDDVQKLSGCA